MAKCAITDTKHFITEEEEDYIMNEADPDIDHLIQEQIDEEQELFENKKKEEDPDEVGNTFFFLLTLILF